MNAQTKFTTVSLKSAPSQHMASSDHARGDLRAPLDVPFLSPPLPPFSGRAVSPYLHTASHVCSLLPTPGTITWRPGLIIRTWTRVMVSSWPSTPGLATWDSPPEAPHDLALSGSLGRGQGTRGASSLAEESRRLPWESDYRDELRKITGAVQAKTFGVRGRAVSLTGRRNRCPRVLSLQGARHSLEASG